MTRVAPARLSIRGGRRDLSMTADQRRAEFRNIFSEHREPVFRFLWRLTGNPHDAEDLLQDTFVTFWRKWGQFRGAGSLSGYLKKIAFRTWLNARSRVAAKHPPQSLPDGSSSTNPAPEETVEKEETLSFLLDRVREALATLPHGAREAFQLFRFEGMSVAEVAEVTGAPLKTIESRLKRATELLAARLEKYRSQLPAR